MDGGRDASDVGVACSVCAVLDFLPFRCQHCRLPFCKDHARAAAEPATHDCKVYVADLAVTEAVASSDASASFKDYLPDRTATGPPPPTAEQLERQAKKEAALAVLHKNFPHSATSVTGKMTVASKKIPSKTVLLMKLKQTAKPLDPSRSEKQVGIKDRRYFFAGKLAQEDLQGFWIQKTSSCGKTLDLLSTALGIPNNNNLPSTLAKERLTLAKQRQMLTMSRNIAEVIEDGDEIAVCRIEDLELRYFTVTKAPQAACCDYCDGEGCLRELCASYKV